MTKKPSILITGVSGKVGSECYAVLKNNYDSVYDIIGTYNKHKIECQQHLDITNLDDVNAVFSKFKPKIIIHTAAIVHPPECEKNKQFTWKTNVEAVENIVKNCKKLSCKMVYLSSDAVYETKNSPIDELDPIRVTNYYSKTKIEAEKLVKTLNEYMIIRSSWINDANLNSKSYVMQVIKTLKEEKTFFAPIDYFGHPTLSRNLAEIIIELIILKKSGIFNVAGSTFIDRYNFAQKIAQYFCLNSKMIKPNSSNSDGIPRPLRINLNLEKLKSHVSTKMLSLDEQLEYMTSSYKL